MQIKVQIAKKNSNKQKKNFFLCVWKTRMLILLTRAGGGALEAEETYFDQLMQNVSSLVRQDKDMDKAKRRRLVFLVLKHSHSLTHELKVTH